MRVLLCERSILGDERSLLVGKWSMNGKTGGVRDENGTGRRNAEEAKAGEEVKSGGSESRVKR